MLYLLPLWKLASASVGGASDKDITSPHQSREPAPGGVLWSPAVLSFQVSMLAFLYMPPHPLATFLTLFSLPLTSVLVYPLPLSFLLPFLLSLLT